MTPPLERVFRDEWGRVLATLIGLLGDFDLAEEAAQDAFATAAARWERDGVPANPRAWLLTTARNRAIDRIRRERVLGEKTRLLEAGGRDDITMDDDTAIPDERLELVFTCCHPALALDAQVALTLRTLGGLTTPEIARAFLVPEPTIAQRIVRAKKTLSGGKVPFEVPRGSGFGERLSSVLQVIYLVFNEGYSATAGDALTRPALAEEAMRLGRVLAGLVPDEAEVHGLVALMELQASRMRARVGPGGEPVLLLDQDRSRWDQLLIRRGLAALDRADALREERGPYTLQAAIAACHARARLPDETDWREIAALYAQLVALVPSPIVELNRGVAVAMADGPAAGLAVVDSVASDPALAGYALLPSVRADLLARLGRHAEARTELQRASSLTRNARELELLRRREAELPPA